MKKNYSKLVYIMDRSTSMGSLTEKSVEGFNSFVDEQKGIEGQADLTLVTFDSQYEVVFENVNIQDVKHITKNDIFARGMTKLLDGVGKTIDSVGSGLDSKSEDQHPEHVIFVIMTDGEENSSEEYSRERVKELIEQQQNQYNWTFLFMGANIDAFEEAGSLGISSHTTSNYVADTQGMARSYGATSSYVGKVRTGSVNMSLSDEEKEADSD